MTGLAAEAQSPRASGAPHSLTRTPSLMTTPLPPTAAANCSSRAASRPTAAGVPLCQLAPGNGFTRMVTVAAAVSAPSLAS